LWTPRPSSQSGTPAAPRRLAAAGDAGHRARLGRNFLQVPPPSPTRARRPPSLPSSRRMPPCFGHRRAVSARSRRIHRRAPQHACAATLEARPGLWPIFVPTPSLAAVPRTAAPP
jgi:hypothetical protein